VNVNGSGHPNADSKDFKGNGSGKSRKKTSTFKMNKGFSLKDDPFVHRAFKTSTLPLFRPPSLVDSASLGADPFDSNLPQTSNITTML
jgi:hypothetical protein